MRHSHAIIKLPFALALTLIALLLVATTRPTPALADDSQHVTIAEAKTQAAATGEPVLATAETTESSSITANPDGSLGATIGAGPLQEPDADSPTGWSPIDLTLQHVDDGYAPAVSSADVTFSDGGAGSLATLDEGRTSYSEDWAGSLPTPSISSDTATYANILTNVDLTMQAQTSGFKQDFVIKAAPAEQLVLSVPLSLRGLTATVDEDGNLLVTDNQGRTVATAGTAVMYDAALNDTGEPAHSVLVDTQIVTTSNGPVFQISPPQSFFNNPDVTYPVTVDPSPDLNATQDAFVKQSDPTSSFSSNNQLKIGTPDGTELLRTLINFPTMPTVTGPVIINGATLSLFEDGAGSCTPTELDVYRATSSWGNTVSWNTQPAAGTLYASASAAHGFDTSCPSDWVNIGDGGAGDNTLTDLVQGWADGSIANDGLIIRASSEGSVSGWKAFNSSESGSNTPLLLIDYNETSSCDGDVCMGFVSSLPLAPDATFQCNGRVCLFTTGDGLWVDKWWTTAEQYKSDGTICYPSAYFEAKGPNYPFYEVVESYTSLKCAGPIDGWWISYFEHGHRSHWQDQTHLGNAWDPTPPFDGFPTATVHK